MYTERKRILHKLGFDTKLKGAEYFSDIISEVMPDIENNATLEEIEYTIETSYLEFGHFIYEVGVNRLKSIIRNFHGCRNPEKIDKQLYSEIYSDNYNPTVNDSIISIASYLVREKQNQPTQKLKQLVK